MKSVLRSDLGSRTAAAALALCVFAGTTAGAAVCADPQEMSALRAAALRQQLMVAALTCHEAAYFNRFITSYGDEYQDSDRALMAFFVRQGSGEAGYNAYKTREANDFSLKSLNDARFCGRAEGEFYDALERNMSLKQLAAFEAPLLRTGYAACTRSADASDAAPFAAPALPQRHREVADDEAAAAQPTSDPATPPTRVAQVQANDATADSDGARDPNTDANVPPPAYQAAYRAPYYGNPWYGYGYTPGPMRQVQGADGRWYLVPAYYR